MAKGLSQLPIQFDLEEERKTNPELTDQDLQILREWCEKQPHLPKIPDAYLVMFLHSNYYRLEPTKSTIENYFTIRTHVPEFFSNRDPIGCKDLRKAFKIQLGYELSRTTAEGYKVAFAKLLDADPSHYVFSDSVKYFYMEGDLVLLRNLNAKGWVFVGDCSGVSLGHMGRLSPLGLKKLVCYVQDALPIRLKGIHWINAPSVMEMIVNMAKPFMSKEFWSLIHFHSSVETLAEYVPLDILPNDYKGGKAESCAESAKKVIKDLEDHRDFFLEEQAVFRVNESLRVGKGKSANDLFGVEGSFKKLDID